MIAKVRFTKPSLITPWGAWMEITGELDLASNILWVDRPEGRYGVHIASRAIIGPLPIEAKAPEAKPAKAKIKEATV